MPDIMTTLWGRRRTRTRLVNWEARNTDTGIGRKATPAQRAVVLHLLEKLAQEEEHPVHARIQEPSRDVRRRPGGGGEQPQGEDRFVDSGLGVDEEGHEQSAADESCQCQWLGPADVPRLDQPEDDSGHPQGRAERADEVEAALTTLGLRQHHATHEPDGDADGNVHEHHPPPRHELGQQTAGHEPDGAAGRRDGGVHGDGPHALRAFGKDARQQREGGGRRQRAPDALEGPGGEEHPPGDGQTACQRTEREQGQSAEEGPTSPQQISRPRPEEEQTAEGEDVGVQHPRQGWDTLHISRGGAALGRADEISSVRGPNALQAAIAACHSRAFSPEETDWPEVVALYDALSAVMPSPIVELNRAVAVSMAEGPAPALVLVDEPVDLGVLDRYHLLHSVRGDLLGKLERYDEAAAAFARAAELAQNEPECELMARRAAEPRARAASSDRAGSSRLRQ
jgi:hypothetical protein